MTKLYFIVSYATPDELSFDGQLFAFLFYIDNIFEADKRKNLTRTGTHIRHPHHRRAHVRQTESSCYTPTCWLTDVVQLDRLDR